MQRELPATATKAEAPIKTAKPVDASFSVGQSKELRPDEATPKEARPDGARPDEAKDRPDRSESVGAACPHADRAYNRDDEAP
jgi:hypothetical protein